DRRSGPHRRGDRALGVDRRRRDQLHRERGRDDPAGRGAGEPAPLPGRGQAALPEGLTMLFGTAYLDALAAGAPRMPSLDAEPTALTGAEVLQAALELPGALRECLLPPALH